MSFEREHLNGLVGKALVQAGKDQKQREFVAYLSEQIFDRLDRGRGMDCDEYRALRSQVGLA